MAISRAGFAQPLECRIFSHVNGYRHRCGFPSAPHLTRSEECTNDHTSQQELHVSREAPRAVPPGAAVKQFAAVWAKKRCDVLEVRSGARRCPENRRIQGAAPDGEEPKAG